MEPAISNGLTIGLGDDPPRGICPLVDSLAYFYFLTGKRQTGRLNCEGKATWDEDWDLSK